MGRGALALAVSLSSGRQLPLSSLRRIAGDGAATERRRNRVAAQVEPRPALHPMLRVACVVIRVLKCCNFIFCQINQLILRVSISDSGLYSLILSRDSLFYDLGNCRLMSDVL